MVQPHHRTVLVLGGRFIGFELAFDIVRASTRPKFSRRDRYVARFNKVEELERGD